MSLCQQPLFTIKEEVLDPAPPSAINANSLVSDIKIEDSLLLELQPLSTEAQYVCNLCSFRTKHKLSLQRHARLHNRDQLPTYHCDVCNFETIYERHLQVHVTVLHRNARASKPFKCDECPYECNYRENLTRHKKTHLHPDERQSFVCQICNFQTFYRKSYRVHMEMIHQVMSDKSEESEFKCYHCPFETKYRVNIVRHLKTHMKNLATVYKCTDCDFGTIHKNNFNTHMLRHRNPGKIRMYHCQHCSHKTSYKASLRTHLKLHMRKEEVETYRCVACKFVTLYERSYKLHMLNIHNSDHPAIEYFKCNFCKFETRYRENWRRHERGHLKPGKRDSYSCPECSFSTVQQGRFEKHLLVHSQSDLEASRLKSRKRCRAVVDRPALVAVESKVFHCSHCVFKTLVKAKLEAHEATEHSPSQIKLTPPVVTRSLECGSCPFTTVHRASLRRHLETHLKPQERKQFKCPTCVYRSYTRARVNRHVCPFRAQN